MISYNLTFNYEKSKRSIVGAVIVKCTSSCPIFELLQKSPPRLSDHFCNFPKQNQAHALHSVIGQLCEGGKKVWTSLSALVFPFVTHLFLSVFMWTRSSRRNCLNVCSIIEQCQLTNIFYFGAWRSILASYLGDVMTLDLNEDFEVFERSGKLFVHMFLS